ncbi:alpha/beta fold hydrolase [Streptomyces sp. NPDC101152]|uniref:alpha/beta fold hydrolase n=1 Tax=Streptomyces sp. NPDC101152 TaxID=3366116 RepID=UPI0037F7C0AC
MPVEEDGGQKFKEWTDPAASSARFYYEVTHPANRLQPSADPVGARPERSPTLLGVAVFPHEALPIRALAERFANVVHWTEFDRGGHFAAMEQPELLVGDIRTFFRELTH